MRLAVFFLIAGCASTSQKLEPTTIYRKDIKISCCGRAERGAIVLPKGEVYKISIEARGNLDLFTMTTCHREEIRENAGEGGIFGNKRKVDFGYIPVSPLETKGACPIFLSGFEKDKGRNSWGFIDFESDDNKLRAEVICNGKSMSANGVSVCQTRAGLKQMLTFDEEVMFTESPSGCSKLDSSYDLSFGDKMSISYKMSKGECVYVFMGKSSKNIHRHTSLGYEDILVRTD